MTGMKKGVALVLATLMTLSLSSCAATGIGGQGADAGSAESTKPQLPDESAVAQMLQDMSVAEFEEQDMSKDYSTGTPWPDTDLEGVVTEDMPTDPKDNFVLYVNKDDILKLEIPEGYPYAGTMMDLVLKNDEDLKKMFRGAEPESHDAKLAYNLYGLMMDWDSRNKAGVAPLKERTDAVEKIDSIDAMTKYVVENKPEDVLTSVWKCGSMQDFADSSKYVLGIEPPRLLLEDPAEYGTLTDIGEIRKEAVTELIRKILVKMGYSREDAEKKINGAMAFERMLAPSIYTSEERNSPDILQRMSNYYTRKELEKAQNNLPLLDTIEKSLGFPEADEYLIPEPKYIEMMSKLYTEENLSVIKDFMIVHGVMDFANLLDRECYEWHNDYENAIRGSSGILDDETVFASQVSVVLTWPVARLYTEKYLKEEDKERVSKMVDELLDTYHGILEEADFLSEETCEKALEKLDAMGKRVLYPDDWEKYSCEELKFAAKEDGGTLWDAMNKIRAYYNAERVEEYSKPFDKEKWRADPQTVNCFYDVQSNNISIMGAFAQGSMYNSEMSDEELYAKLGAVIAHEISHAFDSSGAQFDKDGNMANWWTDEDLEKFNAKNKKMADYFNAMHPWEGQDFHGSIMTGEACADMAGLKCVLRAVSGKKGFDYDKFFRAYANVWLTKERWESARGRIEDVHPMPYLRINATLQQFDEFLDFYDIKEGDRMYLAPEDRVNIW